MTTDDQTMTTDDQSMTTYDQSTTAYDKIMITDETITTDYQNNDLR